jgi:Zn finger protein HypA/HybF involved in hydrogenase expression
MAKKFSTDEFIARAKAIHGNRYEYSESQYNSKRKPITYKCFQHGAVTQKASAHLKGSGCTLCGYASKRKKTQLSPDEFISRAKAVHGEKYDYSETEYVVKRTPVTIICREHGIFSQMPQNHLAGRGCSSCHRDNPINHKLGVEEYIARAQNVHGNTYDYSDTKYSHSQKKLRIICRIHGRFERYAADHLQGRGCPACGKLNRRAPEKVGLGEFVKRSVKQHENKYDYSKVSFASVGDYVTIICLEHGDFAQKARAHYEGNGCPKCGRMRKNVIAIYQQEFIQQARGIHGEKYDYSGVKFRSKRNSERIEIICREHGAFRQNPMNHIRGSGCPECAGNSPHTTSSFVEAARGIHGMKYEYDNVTYVNSSFPVRITCQKHGDFSMGPSLHLAGRGCRRCGDERRTDLSRLTTEEFITGAKAVHGEAFDYSESVYANNNTRIAIKCPTHGTFNQLPRSHLSGIGCPRCSSSKGEALIRSVLEKLKISFREQAGFSDLIFPGTGGRLRFDFYIEKTQTAIEFDGAQHFEPINFSGLTESDLEISFEQLQKRDAFKAQYCKLKSIKLIRIPYTELENIHDLLEEALESEGDL